MKQLRIYLGYSSLLFLLGIMACSTIEPPSKKATSPRLMKMHLAAETIERFLEGTEGKELTRAEMDTKVNELFNQGYNLWKASYTAKSLTLSAVYYANIDILFKAVISYYEGSGRLGLAVPYLIKSRDEALSYYILGGYLEYQQRLIDAYSDLGLYDLARKEIVKMEEDGREFYPYDESAPLEDLEPYAVFLRVNDIKNRLKLALAVGDQGQWQEEYQYVMAARKHFPALKYMTTDRKLDRGTTIDTMGGEDADRLYDRTEGELFFLFAKWFALNKKEKESLAALQVVKESYDSNVNRIQFIDMDTAWQHLLAAQRNNLSGTTDGFYENINVAQIRRDKLIRRCVPFRSRSWKHSQSAEIHYLLGKYSSSLELLKAAKFEFAQLMEHYTKLPVKFRLFDDIETDSLNLKLLEAKNLEKLKRYEEATALYREHIAFAETVRQSLPVEKRNHFFQSTARESYFGLLRCAAAEYQASPNDKAFSQVLAAAESFRSRQLRELLQLNAANEDEAINLAKLRGQLPPKSGALVVVDLADKCLVVFFDNTSHSARIFDKNAAWDKKIFTLRNRLAESQLFDYAGMREISLQIFTGIEERLADTERLYVLPDGALSALPLEIFPIWGSSILADLATVSYLPSLSLLGESKASTQEKQFFAVADPTYDAEESIDRHIGRVVMQATRGSSDLSMFQALPETRDEVQDILSGFTNKGTMLLGPEATESTIKKMDLSPYSHVHFATHGVIGGEIPTLNEPALVLSYEDGEDGFLTASEVSRLNLNAEMTVLSACNTGNGEYFRGEGLMGIGRAFMIAGSKQVVVSLWPVDSLATKELMVSFYQQMAQGLDAPTALAAAKRAFYLTSKQQQEVQSARGIDRKRVKASKETPKRFRQRGNPFFWSPFIVISAES